MPVAPSKSQTPYSFFSSGDHKADVINWKLGITIHRNASLIVYVFRSQPHQQYGSSIYRWIFLQQDAVNILQGYCTHWTLCLLITTVATLVPTIIFLSRSGYQLPLISLLVVLWPPICSAQLQGALSKIKSNKFTVHATPHQHAHKQSLGFLTSLNTTYTSLLPPHNPVFPMYHALCHIQIYAQVSLYLECSIFSSFLLSIFQVSMYNALTLGSHPWPPHS